MEPSGDCADCEAIAESMDKLRDRIQHPQTASILSEARDIVRLVNALCTDVDPDSLDGLLMLAEIRDCAHAIESAAVGWPP